MNFFKKNNQEGQSIIEAIVAVTVVTMIIIALVSAVTVSISSSTFAKNKSLANKFVNQGIEAVRSIRDRSWSELVAGSLPNPGKINGLRNNAGQWEFNGSSDVPATPFTRRVTVTNLNPAPGEEDQIKVTVEVSFPSGAKTFKSESTTNLTKWK